MRAQAHVKGRAKPSHYHEQQRRNCGRPRLLVGEYEPINHTPKNDESDGQIAPDHDCAFKVPVKQGNFLIHPQDNKPTNCGEYGPKHPSRIGLKRIPNLVTVLRCKSAEDRAKFRDALATITASDGLIGPVTRDTASGEASKPYVYVQVVDGKWKVIHDPRG